MNSQITARAFGGKWGFFAANGSSGSSAAARSPSRLASASDPRPSPTSRRKRLRSGRYRRGWPSPLDMVVSFLDRSAGTDASPDTRSIDIDELVQAQQDLAGAGHGQGVVVGTRPLAGDQVLLAGEEGGQRRRL